MAASFDPYEGISNRKKNAKRETPADVTQMFDKQRELYLIYGLQEPGPLDPRPVRMRRGRVT